MTGTDDQGSPLERAAEQLSERRDAALERMGEARDAASERMAGARDAASERMADARDAAAERVADAKAAAAEQIAKVKPRLRGVSHEYAFFVSLVLGAGLIVLANGLEARSPSPSTPLSLSALFGVSALYHRVDWKRPNVRRWMRRLDHTMIFFLIAGTVTPFALLVLEPPLATALLIAVWAGALARHGRRADLDRGAEVGLGDRLRRSRADRGDRLPGDRRRGRDRRRPADRGRRRPICDRRRRLCPSAPDPSPAVFGYHEIFHVFVIAAAAVHFAAIALYAVPA